jgi:uncharacterized protein YndB with AHSA1/START domain
MTNETKALGLTMSRQIPATPDEVFDAYTDAEKQTIWFNLLSEHPGIVEIEVDLRVGGKQTAVWGRSRDELFTEVQTFLEIDRPHRLVTSSTGNDPSGMEMTTEIVVTFDANEEGTLMTVVQTGFPTVEMRDFFANYAMVGAFDRIVAFFEQGLNRP